MVTRRVTCAATDGDKPRPSLPMTFTDSLDAMKADTFLTGILGEPFVSAYETLKRDEIRRYEEAVADPQTRDITQWELDEYIEDF